jgi:hypothetical protein
MNKQQTAGLAILAVNILAIALAIVLIWEA